MSTTFAIESVCARVKAGTCSVADLVDKSKSSGIHFNSILLSCTNKTPELFEYLSKVDIATAIPCDCGVEVDIKTLLHNAVNNGNNDHVRVLMKYRPI